MAEADELLLGFMYRSHLTMVSQKWSSAYLWCRLVPKSQSVSAEGIYLAVTRKHKRTFFGRQQK